MSNDSFSEIFASIFPEIKYTSKKQLMVRCIYHPDQTASLSINLERGIYNCFGCGKKGNYKTLIKQLKGEYNE